MRLTTDQEIRPPISSLAPCVLQSARGRIGERVRPRQALRFSGWLGPEKFSFSGGFGWSFPLPIAGEMSRRFPP